MKALKAAAGTSQPVLSTEEVRTVFYQIPELRDLHKDFYTSLKTRLHSEKGLDQEDSSQNQGTEESAVILYKGDPQVPVGDLFLKFVSFFGVYVKMCLGHHIHLLFKSI